MRKNKTLRLIFNGGLLAVMAVLGVTAYQVSNKKEHIQEVLPLESEKEEQKVTDDGKVPGAADSLAETGTSLVEAKMEENAKTDILNEKDLTGAADTTVENTADIGESTSVNAPALADNAPEINFSEDTLMEWPVSGQILIDYSMDQSVYFPTLDQYKLSPAISVQAVEGAPVMSAVSGTVYSIDNNAQTGTTVTMELGNGYQAIYGQLTDLNVAEGDTVKKGAIIGYVAAPTKYYSEEGSNLYFAMKKDGEPIDPIAYLP